MPILLVSSHLPPESLAVSQASPTGDDASGNPHDWRKMSGETGDSPIHFAVFSHSSSTQPTFAKLSGEHLSGVSPWVCQGG
jgi:hypothetical protein